MIKDPAARLIQTQGWDTYRLFTLESPDIAGAAAPGQFIMVRVSSGTQPLLRRPFSIHAVTGDQIHIFFQVVGAGTRLLAETVPEQALDILGPLGRGFDFKDVPPGGKAVLVGGGRGIAPLYFLAERLRALGTDIRILYGGRSLQDLPLRERFQAADLPLVCSTDDGSHGYKGLVTECLRLELNQDSPDRMFACGPDAMLETVAAMSQEFAIPAQLSLEAVMGCGFGACWGCVHRIRREGSVSWHKVCEDGPVFPAESVVWEGVEG
jgi:dihydroorotate dehydrogenase electron transfer subunit